MAKPSVDSLDLLRLIVPLRRDIVSDGIDEALDRLCQRFPLTLHSFSSGTPCWSWHIPEKWTCEEAYVEDMRGNRIIDQKDNPLFVSCYSVPVDKVISRDELLTHLHFHPHVPDTPPFTFYHYQRHWGFGCTRQQQEALTEDQYRVVIRSRLEPGTLRVAEWLLPGESDECIVISTNICHPFQANDGPCGVVNGLQVMTALATWPKRHYSYRLLIGPETIGAVAWLSRHEHLIPCLRGGLYMEMTGLPQPAGLQASYQGNTEFDRCLAHVHLHREEGAFVTPYRGMIGNDERQFNAPGVRVPMLSLSRANPWGHPGFPFREYHSIEDSIDNVDIAALERITQTVLAMLSAWENNWYPLNLFKGEAFLQGYGVAVDRNRYLHAHRNMLRIMDCIDGSNSMVAIAERTKLTLEDVLHVVEKMAEAGMVQLLRDPVGRDTRRSPS